MDEGLHILGLRFILRLVNSMYIGLGIAVTLTNVKDPCSLLPIDENAQNTLWHAQKLTDLRDGPDLIEVVRRRIVKLRISLRHDEDSAVTCNRTLNRGNRAVPSDVEIDHHVRIDHQAAQRKQWKRFFLGHRNSFRLCQGNTFP